MALLGDSNTNSDTVADGRLERHNPPFVVLSLSMVAKSGETIIRGLKLFLHCSTDLLSFAFQIRYSRFAEKDR